MKTLKPLIPFVLIEDLKVEAEQKTASGIIIPDSAKEKKFVAKIIAISNIEEREVEAGDTILYTQFTGEPFEFEGTKYRMLAYKEILGKVED